MSEQQQQLDSNPEILLRKRRNADKLRLEKQQLAKKRENDKKINKLNNRKSKFIRVESLIAKNKASIRENYRIKRLSNSLKDQKDKEQQINNDNIDNNIDDKLIFIVRIQGPLGAKIPNKSKKILNILRLNHLYNGVFIKLNSNIEPLLKLISPYIVIGKPSLSTIRNLIQKRGQIDSSITNNTTTSSENIIQDNNTEGEIINDKQVITSSQLNDNNYIEEKLGEYGIICVEDIIHEIVTIGDNFKIVCNFLKPFELNPPINGWGPLSKLKRLEQRESNKNLKLNSKNSINSAFAKLQEINIDDFISEQI
ncbi:hypothetical protein B5S31_g5417 [[Candida] boidinii]|uniref:Unnamed protein product n=1 Tax=Candida boidinii TaxID=5477 RepID=A0ACB5TKV0_CANBO|nr:hypothetical protein B5S31_g5417 [[Candida] boidinii]OWB81073.1 hypothetical protein B5S32_g5423 [[Candida] boidinii]GME90509.1 unnamed protein product [[Candida] boidinii]